MYHMRPGNKLPLRGRKYKFKPSVEPPGLLRLASALAIISIVGTTIYAVTVAVADISSSDIGNEAALYVAILHFLLPFGVACTVTTNHPASRYIIAAYCIILYSATIAGKGYLGSPPIDRSDMIAYATAALAIVLAWLLASPKMRLYYLLLADRPIPPDLESRASQLDGKNWISPRVRTALNWTIERMEILVLLGFTILAVFSCVDL